MAANLALTMAQGGSRVCLVEADLRRPKVLDYLGLEGAVGLTDALIGRADVFDVIQPYGGTNLWVLGAGPIPPNPSELLGSTAMRSTLNHLADALRLRRHRLPAHAARSRMPWCSRASSTARSWSWGRASCSATSWPTRSRAWSRSPGACSASCSTGAGQLGRHVRLLRLRGSRGRGHPSRAQAGRARPDPAEAAARSARQRRSPHRAGPARPAAAQRRPRPPSARTGSAAPRSGR